MAKPGNQQNGATAAADQEALDAEAKAKADPDPGPRVAARHSITTKRGILGAGKRINPEDLAGKQSAIDAFIKSGHIDPK